MDRIARAIEIASHWLAVWLLSVEGESRRLRIRRAFRRAEHEIENRGGFSGSIDRDQAVWSRLLDQLQAEQERVLR